MASPIYVYLFVYGSLRKGLPNNRKLDTSKYLGIYKTESEYYMIGLKSNAYPYVVKEQIHDTLEKTQITGELYEITDEKLKELDVLEGHPYSYTRNVIDVYNVDTNKHKKAFIYILENEEQLKEIPHSIPRRFISVPSGDWKQFIEK